MVPFAENEEDEADGGGGVGATGTMDSNRYTDTSLQVKRRRGNGQRLRDFERQRSALTLQYADDEGGEDEESSGGERGEADADGGEANTSSYSSNNRASTLPIRN